MIDLQRSYPASPLLSSDLGWRRPSFAINESRYCCRDKHPEGLIPEEKWDTGELRIDFVEEQDPEHAKKWQDKEQLPPAARSSPRRISHRIVSYQ